MIEKTFKTKQGVEIKLQLQHNANKAERKWPLIKRFLELYDEDLRNDIIRERLEQEFNVSRQMLYILLDIPYLKSLIDNSRK